MSADLTETGGTQRPMRRLLVANRGEIARRVFRTARRLGIETVAVFSEPDRRSAHVRDADLAVALGGTTSAESYLDIDKLLLAATKVGVDAIHPGYGFLSENPIFAERVLQAGLTWVGPTPDSIRAMAGKIDAKRLAAAAGLPLIPGAELDADADSRDLARAAALIGYPLLVKASAGGGGKGMRLVESEDDLVDAVAGARREAQASFGDPTVFFERYLCEAHHVEVQVFGDTHGNFVHLRDRECSIQRRHQKIVEESPSPSVTSDTAARMYSAAVSLAASIGYVGAGTVEFMVTGYEEVQEFYFLEMNTRLQVEHPVTEVTTTPSVDLVEWQLLVAQGLPLPYQQEDLGWSRTHAIEVRLYAEDPASGFLPSTGRLVEFGTTASPTGRNMVTRDDLGVEADDTVSQYYDPMIGKIIGDGRTREEAALGLAAALATRDIVGITTNRDSLVAILRSPDFLAGNTTTRFVDDHPELLAPLVDESTRKLHLIAATIATAAVDATRQPWRSLAPIGWRNVAAVPARFDWTYDEAGERHDEAVIVDWLGAGAARIAIATADETSGRTGSGAAGEQVEYEVHVIARGADVALQIDGVLRRCRVGIDGEWVWVNDGSTATSYRRTPTFRTHGEATAGAGPSAPVPGTIVAVNVTAGDTVEEGQTLVVLEAMKMEHRVVAPTSGLVAEVLVETGGAVDAHQLLVRINACEEESS